jgi:hypothetical protein
MSLALILAYLLASGACAETEFRAADGSRLTVLVCPRAAAAETAPPAEQAQPLPEKRT